MVIGPILINLQRLVHFIVVMGVTLSCSNVSLEYVAALCAYSVQKKCRDVKLLGFVVCGGNIYASLKKQLVDYVQGIVK